MSRIFTLFIFITFFGNVSAQNWQPFIQMPVYYRSLTNLTTSEPVIKFKENELLGGDIVLFDPNAGEYHPKKIVGCDLRDQFNNCNGEVCTDNISWIGRTLSITPTENKILNLDSIWIFIPKKGDTLIQMLNDQGLIYSAVLMNIIDSTVLNEVDSIAKYQIIVHDSVDTVFNNPWHGKNFIISKNHGMTLTPSWNLFPNYEVWFSLNRNDGFSYSFDKIHNWDIGTIIQYQRHSSKGKFQIGDLYYKTVQSQCTIVGIDTVNLARSYRAECASHYDVKTYEIGYNGYLYLAETENFIKTFLDTFNYQFGVFYFMKMPLFASPSQIPRSFSNYTSYYVNSKNQIEINQSIGGEYIDNDSCLKIHYPFEPHFLFNYRGIAGIGEVFWSGGHLDDYIYGSSTDWESFVLTYFKSDSIEYGTPGWPIGVEEISIENAVSVFPNPVNDVLHLQSTEPIISAKIYSISGDLLFEATQEQLVQKALDVSELPKGIYLLKVQLADHSETHRIVK